MFRPRKQNEVGVRVIVFVCISWWSLLFVKETGVPKESN